MKSYREPRILFHLTASYLTERNSWVLSILAIVFLTNRENNNRSVSTTWIYANMVRRKFDLSLNAIDQFGSTEHSSI